MRINLAAILCVKIAWSHASKLFPRTDAYKMVVTTVMPQQLINQKYVYAATPRPRERYENANIFIFTCTFQETVGSHLKPSLPVVVMATLCYGNNLIETFFVVSVNSSPLAKILEYISIHIYMQPQLHPDEFY